jgi:hypothetical protein
MGFAARIVSRIGDVLEFEFHRDPSDGEREPIAVIDGVACGIVHHGDPITGIQPGGDVVVVAAPSHGQFVGRQVAAEVDAAHTACRRWCC